MKQLFIYRPLDHNRTLVSLLRWLRRTEACGWRPIAIHAHKRIPFPVVAHWIANPEETGLGLMVFHPRRAAPRHKEKMLGIQRTISELERFGFKSHKTRVRLGKKRVNVVFLDRPLAVRRLLQEALRLERALGAKRRKV